MMSHHSNSVALPIYSLICSKSTWWYILHSGGGLQIKCKSQLSEGAGRDHLSNYTLSHLKHTVDRVFRFLWICDFGTFYKVCNYSQIIDFEDRLRLKIICVIFLYSQICPSRETRENQNLGVNCLLGKTAPAPGTLWYTSISVWFSAGSMSSHGIRRWPSIKPTLGWCVLFCWDGGGGNQT